jgi:hypothetical protein
VEDVSIVDDSVDEVSVDDETVTVVEDSDEVVGVLVVVSDELVLSVEVTG